MKIRIALKRPHLDQFCTNCFSIWTISYKLCFNLDKCTNCFSIRINVHGPKTRSLIDELGIDLQPATATSIGIEEVFDQIAFTLHANNVENQAKFSRLEAPYTSECISEWSSTNYSTFTGDKSWTYTEEVAIICFLFPFLKKLYFFPPLHFFGGVEC